MKIEHLSVSRINTYLRCPLQYYYRYDRKLIVPPKGIMTLGKSIHFGIEGNYRQKIETRVDLSVDDVLDIYSTDFEQRKHDTLWQKDEKPAEIKDEGVNLLSKYHGQIAPQVQPAFVEEKFQIEFENFDTPLLGYFDLIDDKETIVDHKTTSKAASVVEKETNESLQLTGYSLGYRAHFQKIERGIRTDVMIKPRSNATRKKKLTQEELAEKVKVESFKTARTEQQINRFLRTIAHVTSAIKENVFYPCASGWACTPDYCGYYVVCHKEW